MSLTGITCSRRIQFAAGHRVHGHESKCRNLHGHNYVVWFTARMDTGPRDLDSLGRVIDFSVLKEKLGGWIDTNWDHGFLVWGEDHEALRALGIVETQKEYLCPFNPTAEEMAKYLLHVIGPQELKGTGVSLVRVEIFETENCSAVAELGYRTQGEGL